MQDTVKTNVFMCALGKVHAFVYIRNAGIINKNINVTECFMNKSGEFFDI